MKYRIIDTTVLCYEIEAENEDEIREMRSNGTFETKAKLVDDFGEISIDPIDDYA